jgi:3-phenylpropionate/trans-cinnamate dioxygenase ferredoxin reductase subunit
VEHGVDFIGGASVEAIEGESRVEAVRLAGDRRIEADFVVVGVGIAPRVELAREAGLELDNGIAVDQLLRTSAERVYAAGDAANAYHPFYQSRVRVEHWANALNQGPAAARSMLGKGEPYERIPYFFSDQYEVGMEYAGYATRWDEVVFRGDSASRELLVFWLAEGRVLAGMNMNVWDVNDQIQELIRSRRQIDRERLADPDLPLDELAGAPKGTPEAAPPRPPEGFLAQGINYARRFVHDRFTKPEETLLSELAPGDAKVIGVDGDKVAAYRDQQGDLHAASAVCTHMGCLVEWNGVEKTWDCPCHGSRFDCDGHVLQGPAKRDLESVAAKAGASAAASR